jgi:hypothetical protein
LYEGRVAEFVGAVRGGIGVNFCHSRLLSPRGIEFAWLPDLISDPRAEFPAPRSTGAAVRLPKLRGGLLFEGPVLRGPADIFPLFVRPRLPKPLLEEPFCPWPKRCQFEPPLPGLAASRPREVESRPLREGDRGLPSIAVER